MFLLQQRVMLQQDGHFPAGTRAQKFKQHSNIQEVFLKPGNGIFFLYADSITGESGCTHTESQIKLVLFPAERVLTWLRDVLIQTKQPS